MVHSQTHPAVLESAAVGTPDLARGEAVKAFIILSEDYKHHATGEKAKTLISEITVSPPPLLLIAVPADPPSLDNR